jgi:hypothetical protein
LTSPVYQPKLPLSRAQSTYAPIIYAIERIRRPRGKIEYISEAFIDDIPAENLAETVLHYGDV